MKTSILAVLSILICVMARADALKSDIRVKDNLRLIIKGASLVPDKLSGQECFLIDKGHRTFTGDMVELQLDTAYTIAFKYRSDQESLDPSGQVFTPQAACFQIQVYNGADKEMTEALQCFINPGPQWKTGRMYFYSGKNTAMFFKYVSFSPVSNLYINDVTLTATTDDQFKGNLAADADGDFKHWTACRPWRPAGLPVPPLPVFFLDRETGFPPATQSLKIDCKKGDGFSVNSPFFPVRNGRTYICSVWLKSNVEWFPMVACFYTLPMKNRVHIYKTSCIGVGQDWKEYEFEIDIPNKEKVGYMDKARFDLGELSNDSNRTPQTPAGSLWVGKVDVREE